MSTEGTTYGEPIEDELDDDDDDGGIFAGSHALKHWEKQQELSGPKPDGYRAIADCICGQKMLVEFTWEEVLQHVLCSARRTRAWEEQQRAAPARPWGLPSAGHEEDLGVGPDFRCTACNRALYVQGGGMAQAALAAENGWIDPERWQRFVTEREEILDPTPKEERAKVDLLEAVAKAVDKHGAEAVSDALALLGYAAVAAEQPKEPEKPA
jgi:hypothetical protein